MSPLAKSNNLAARMGRWSAGHWKTAVFGWLAFVVAALLIGQAVGTKQINPQDATVGQSHQADQMLRHAGFESDPQTEIVLVQSRTETVADRGFRAVVAAIVKAVAPFSTIKDLRSPYPRPAAGGTARARRGARRPVRLEPARDAAPLGGGLGR